MSLQSPHPRFAVVLALYGLHPPTPTSTATYRTLAMTSSYTDRATDSCDPDECSKTSTLLSYRPWLSSLNQRPMFCHSRTSKPYFPNENFPITTLSLADLFAPGGTIFTKGKAEICSVCQVYTDLFLSEVIVGSISSPSILYLKARSLGISSV